MNVQVADRQQRADARRNRERVLAAAADVLSESGLKVPVEEIARRAGVGVGTVCRHFPTKQDLVDAVLTLRYEALLGDVQACGADPDAGRAFEVFVARLSAFQARHRALAEQMASELEPSVESTEVRERLAEAISDLVTRAQAVGAVRTDIGPADVSMMISAVAHATALAGDRRGVLRDRYVRIILDGLRPNDGGGPLPGRPLGFAELRRLKARGAGRGGAR
jgi:AcrR family transcriptional regulator